jgi:CRP-like cAMP-binding protein
MEQFEANQGELLIRSGEPGDSLFILLSGYVEIRLPSEQGGPGKRINVFEAGTCFGEMGFLDGSPRSANVVAAAPISYRTISRDAFNRLGSEHPHLKIKLLENLALLVTANLRRSNTEKSAYKG